MRRVERMKYLKHLKVRIGWIFAKEFVENSLYLWEEKFFTMKIGIIGAGNMGGAIARGLAADPTFNTADITVCAPNRHQELDALSAEFPELTVSTDNKEAVLHTDMIILAVKPWMVYEVMDPLSELIRWERQILVSVAAGVGLEKLEDLSLCTPPAVFRVMPNTAISIGKSMTFICSRGANEAQISQVNDLFRRLGSTMLIDESQMDACMALASCGIAYAMRYVRAASEGGVELGIKADEAKEIVLRTLQGAAELLLHTGNHPEVEIDKVTTPGGITIKGLNAMERHGFTTSVIEGLKASK